MTKNLRETVKCVILEFMGVLMINTLSAVTTSSFEHEVITPDKRTMVSISESLLLFFLTTSFAPISGAHFNPALTFPLIITKDISKKEGIIYILTHLTSSIFSCFLVKILSLNFKISRVFGIVEPYPVLNITYYKPIYGLLLELSTTAFLTIAFYTALRNRFSAKELGITVGFVHLMGSLVSGYATGGSMNPARSFGFDLFYHGIFQGFFRRGWWVCYLGPLAGAQLGAFLGNNVFNDSVNVLGIEYEERTEFNISEHDIEMSFGCG